MPAKTPIEDKPIRDLLREKDAFLTTSEKLYEYFLRHTKGFIAFGVVLVLLIIGSAVYVSHQASAELQATEAFEAALALPAGAEGPQTQIAALEKVRTSYQDRKAARLAGFTLIRLYREANDPGSALRVAQDMLQTIKPAEISLKPMLLDTIGGLSEVEGDFKLAAASYEAILNLPELTAPLRMEVLMAVGRSQAAAGNVEAAVKAWETVVREYPRSMNAPIANYRLVQLTGKPTTLFTGLDNQAAPADGSPAAVIGTAPAEDDPAAVTETAPTDDNLPSVEDGAPTD